MTDPYNLARFEVAQETLFDTALTGLSGGRFDDDLLPVIFPRLCLPDSRPDRYGLSCVDEAAAYLQQPLLGNRYRECINQFGTLYSRPVTDVFGVRGAQHLQASLTLFAQASTELLFRQPLSIWFNNRVDEQTANAIWS